MTDRLQQALRLRRLATGLLFLMAALLLGATWGRAFIHPGFVWLQAFAEAALVGGLADWFAVTALFRHPMGLPIPHTAIIPRSKDRIGEALALFLQENFLTTANVARRLQGFDAAEALARLLERPRAAGRVRRNLWRLLRQLFQTSAARSIQGNLQRSLGARLHAVEVAPILGQLLEALIARDQQRPVIDQLIAWADRTLNGEEALIRAMVEERTSWLLRLVKVDTRIADELMAGLRELLAGLANDPRHPVRLRANAALRHFADDLQHRPATRARVEALKDQLLANQAMRDWLDSLWSELQSALLGLETSDTLPALGRDVAQALRDDAALARAVNGLVRRAIVALVADYGAGLVTLVSETVRRWDAQTVTAKLEGAVLRDLQYIRLNGTLIGGSIGVIIHAVLLLAPA